jgi:hypothetical protein
MSRVSGELRRPGLISQSRQVWITRRDRFCDDSMVTYFRRVLA